MRANVCFGNFSESEGGSGAKVSEIDKIMPATKGADGDFYVRYYVGHMGKFGHEYLEFEFRPDGKLRYGRKLTVLLLIIVANNSNYKNDTMIKKEVTVSSTLLTELKRIILDAEILK